MLHFEEIAGLQDEDMRTIYRELTASTLATALKHAPPEVSNKFFANMPSDMAAMIKEVMGKLGEVPEATIEEQRNKVLDIVKSLQSQRKIQ